MPLFIVINNYIIELILYKQTKQPWLYAIIKKALDRQTDGDQLERK